MSSMWQTAIDKSPKLKRGIVYCHRCGNEQKVDPAHCLSHGWPKCCRVTMSIDSPEERERLADARAMIELAKGATHD